MQKIMFVFLVFGATLLAGQSTSPKYESALVLKVQEHHGPIPAGILDPSKDASGPHYDVSIRIKKTKDEYLLLYTPPPGRHGFQYMAGFDVLVLVEDKTVTFNDVLGRSVKVPIVSRKPAAESRR